MADRLALDFDRFADGLPPDLPGYVRDVYRIDLTGRYLGVKIPHPFGKASGQLSLKIEQVQADADAQLAYVVLKTLIAEDASGEQSMAAWAIHESRMQVHRREAADGREGWSVTWKGRGWDRTLDEYLDLVRAARELTAERGMLTVPSVKYHLPGGGEAFRAEEYAYTTGRLAEAWGPHPLLVEKDFSPTLAGDRRADERAQILRWLREVPVLVREAAPYGVRIALKLMNARFDDDFQVAMLEAAAGADGIVAFNRLWDAEQSVAYGGWDLSDRNLRVLRMAAERGVKLPPLAGTGNVQSGRMAVAYGVAGCETVQLHTFFQLPLSEYPARAGSRTARALHALFFHPVDGLIACLLEREREGLLARRDGELRWLDLAARAAVHR